MISPIATIEAKKNEQFFEFEKNHFIFLSHAYYQKKKNTFIYREEFSIRLNFQ